MKPSVRLLSTKTLEPKYSKRLEQNFSLTQEKCIEIEYKNFEISNLNQNWIFTSKNAVKSLFLKFDEKIETNPRIFCVGTKTKELIESYGYRVQNFAKDANSLISQLPQNEHFTFFCGDKRNDALPIVLKEHIHIIEVYKTKLIYPIVNKLFTSYLFFSPSAVESYLYHNQIPEDSVIFAIGNSTAKKIKSLLKNPVQISQDFTIESVIEDVEKYYL